MGEAWPGAVNGHVFDAIPAVMMYRSKIGGCEWGDQDLEEMVDQFMMPLLRPGGARPRARTALPLPRETRVSRRDQGGVR